MEHISSYFVPEINWFLVKFQSFPLYFRPDSASSVSKINYAKDKSVQKTDVDSIIETIKCKLGKHENSNKKASKVFI